MITVGENKRLLDTKASYNVYRCKIGLTRLLEKSKTGQEHRRRNQAPPTPSQVMRLLWQSPPTRTAALLPN